MYGLERREENFLHSAFFGILLYVEEGGESSSSNVQFFYKQRNTFFVQKSPFWNLRDIFLYVFLF